MKKKISVFLLLNLILPFLALSFPVQARVAIGSRSDEVKAIQEVLKSDPGVYPEGYVTGFFGSLTQNAIKKLQKKCGLPETGEVDDATEKCIFPVDYEIKVVSPNGGEVWDRNQIQTIKWEVTKPEASIPEKPLWSKASIDLFRKVGENSVFVKHIANVNLFDESYSWSVGKNIQNGKDYIIRITIGTRIIPFLVNKETTETQGIWGSAPIKPFVNWDESDAPFEITGEIKPTPNLDAVIAILEKMITELQKAISLLKGVNQ